MSMVTETPVDLLAREERGTKNDLFRDWPVLVAGALTFFAIAGYYRAIGFNVVRSDALHYLEWSHHFWIVETGTHFPTYPFLLWLLRLASFGLLDGATLMQTLTLSAYLAGIVVVGQILRHVNPAARRFGVIAYALFPFVGVMYAAYPVGDALFGLILMSALLALVKRAWLPFALCVGVGLICHKALWMSLGLMSLYAWRREGYPLKNLLLSTLPLLGWYAWGYTHLTGLWMFRHHVQVHFTPKKLPIFDGMISPALSGGAKALAKTAYLLALTATAGFLTYLNLRKKQYLWLAFTLPPLFMAVLLNTSVIWSMARFAKPLALPLAIALLAVPVLTKALKNKAAQAAIVAVLALTQIVSAVYVDQFYFGESQRAGRVKAPR